MPSSPAAFVLPDAAQSQAGFHGLLCSTLTLLGVLVAWNLLPRIADGLPYAGAALGWLAPASLMRAGVEAPIGPTWAAPTASLAISVLALLLAVWVLVPPAGFLNPAPPGAGGPPTTRNTDPEIRRCILALRGRLSRRPAESAAATHIGMFLAWALLHGMAGEELIDDSAEALAALQRRGDGRPGS